MVRGTSKPEEELHRVTELGVEKRCPRCGEWWPADSEFFYADANKKDGLNSWCRACLTTWRREDRRMRKHAEAPIKGMLRGDIEPEVKTSETTTGPGQGTDEGTGRSQLRNEVPGAKGAGGRDVASGHPDPVQPADDSDADR